MDYLIFCCLIAICPFTQGGIIDSKLSTLWTFSDSSVFEWTHSFHWSTHEADIKVQIPIGLDDALYGKELKVDVHRIVIMLTRYLI